MRDIITFQSHWEYLSLKSLARPAKQAGMSYSRNASFDGSTVFFKERDKMSMDIILILAKNSLHHRKGTDLGNVNNGTLSLSRKYCHVSTVGLSSSEKTSTSSGIFAPVLYKSPFSLHVKCDEDKLNRRSKLPQYLERNGLAGE